MELKQGTLSNGALVAVKKFSSLYTIDDKQFDHEVKSLIRADHKNIVQFLGYCSNTEQKAIEFKGSFIYADIRERLLCFEYISNGSLQNHLTGTLGNILCSYFLLFHHDILFTSPILKSQSNND